jgi:hypothetical protein
MNNLALMDPTLTTETKINMFRLSLNPRILIYIGESWRSCANVDKLFQLAESAMDPINNNNNGDENMIPFNAGRVEERHPKGRPNNNNNNHSDHKPDVDCFHCGSHGHLAIDCYRYKNGKPQTANGAALFAKWCKLTGRDFVYDPQKFKRHPSQDNPILPYNSNYPNPKSLRKSRPSSPGTKNNPKAKPNPIAKPIPVSDEEDDEDDEDVITQK